MTTYFMTADISIMSGDDIIQKYSMGADYLIDVFKDLVEKGYCVFDPWSSDAIISMNANETHGIDRIVINTVEFDEDGTFEDETIIDAIEEE